jgi:hypothetical protein
VRVVQTVVFGTLVQRRLKNLLELADEADSALKLRLRGILNERKVVRDHESVHDEQFTALDVDKIFGSPLLLCKAAS